MSISTRWYDDRQRVIILEFSSNWTWEEIKQAQETQAELAAAVSHPIIALVDLSQTNTIPKGNVLALGRSTFNNIPPNINLLILVIQSRLLEVFADLIVNMMPAWRNRIRFAKTLEEGQALVAEAVAKNTVGT